jgi:hypothetical protein
VLNGISISFAGGDTARAGAGGAAARDTTRGAVGGGGAAGADGRTSIDTTFTLAISERRWSQPRFAASLAAGVGDTSRAGWHACTGVTLTMQNVTMILRQVRGQVHFKADLTPLLRVSRLGAGGQPR